MSNYEYILNECRKAHYGIWTHTAIDACSERLKGLTRDELVRLFTSRWSDRKCEVREAIFRLLFHEQLEKRKALIRDATIDELGTMLDEKSGNYVKMAREELKKRYQNAGHDTQMHIIRYFQQASTKQDKKWGDIREKWQKRGYANPPSIFDTLNLKKRH